MQPEPPSAPVPIDELRSVALLATLDDAALAGLAGVLRPLALPAGEALFEGRSEAAGLCIVRAGSLDAVELGQGEELPVRSLGPGRMVDPAQTLAGARHPVVVRAAVDSLLWVAPAEEVDRLADRFPDLRRARERLDRRQLLCRLHPILGALDEAFLDDLEAAADWKHVQRGELLFEQHDLGDELCFVVGGMVQTIEYERDGTSRLVAEAGRGDAVGEMEFFTGTRRGTRVRAIRDSVLVAFTAEEFEALVARRPRVLRQITRNVVERARQRGSASTVGRITNIAVVAATPDAPLGAFTRRLTAELERHGSTLALDAATVDTHLGELISAQAWENTPESARLLSWLEACEAQHRFVVYQAESSATPWTRRCLRQADRVLLVARAGADPRCSDVEKGLLALEGRVTDAHEVLVLVHPDGDSLPAGTARWMAERPHAEEHFHLRWHDEADFARLARVLAGRSVGLVLGGGGARGLAHIGILGALTEARVPIDLIGGTSMGATIAAQYAMGWTAERMVEVNRHVFLEVKPHKGYTLPLLSLVNSRRTEFAGRLVYGETRIEDLWLPYFCVSSNLTTAEAMVHREGTLWKATLASSSLPGVGTPILHGNQLLVDGALLNNVPTDVMRGLGSGTVIAAEVSVEDDSTFSCERVPSTWEVLRGRFSRRGRPAVRFPSLMEVLLRSSMLHSTYRERLALEEADLTLRPPIDRFTLMDFPRIDELVEVGYEYTRDAARRWRDGGVFPGEP
jgi:predicted acylesterase/phospholipase RssA/CRP-like cAMP-binding protein